ncbi:deoxyguanosinetriphosphate triphosphohydrolase family protein [Leucobacter sp. GX24907]
MEASKHGAGRAGRRHVERVSSQHRARGAASAAETQGELPLGAGEETPEYRIDLERIRFSSYFARLSEVTQVVPQSGVGPVMHNRLTHSLKVSAVARVIAAQLAGHAASHREHVAGSGDDDEVGRIVTELGGCDTVVAQAAAHAHDLGHPPFGHLGERVLDRVARGRLGLLEGFEGNAQSFRILTHLDTLGREFPGLNLTAASRAATLKYPWTRTEWVGVSENDRPVTERPRGVGADLTAGAEKFSVYGLEIDEMEEALSAFPRLGPGMQTIECAVMDLADDIAYAVHDLDDFTRAGVLQHAAVSGEFRAWLTKSAELSRLPDERLTGSGGTLRTPGHALEALWRRARLKDGWIADRDAFEAAVRRVDAELSEVLATPYDGGLDSERAVSGFTRRWIEHLRTSIVVERNPHLRSGYVRLDRQAWHEVMVLKFVHARFVLESPALAQSQRGQARVVEDLVLAFDEWLADPIDADRAPRRLLEWEEEATEALFALRRKRPEAVPDGQDERGLRRQGRSRALLDYVSSFSDQQAISTHRELIGG